MPACTCTWVVQGAPSDVDLSYDQKSEQLTAKYTVSGTVKTTLADGPRSVSIEVKMRLSIYRFVNGVWDPIERTRLQSHTRDFACNGQNQNFTVKESATCTLDSVHLAGQSLVVLLKCYYEIKGDCGDLGGFSVYRRVGATLTAAAPPVFQTQVNAGVWGTGQNTDGGWVNKANIPSD